MTAYAYVRKSRVIDPTRAISPESQEAAIHALAAKHGDTVERSHIFSDLDISGKRRRERRPGWDALLTAVESGEAHAVYAYSLSRFARSVPQLAEFAELCETKKVRFYVEVDAIDTSTASGKLVFHVIAALAQFESDVASERVRDSFTFKSASDPSWQGPGAVPYGRLDGEDPAAVVAAFREAGSFDGAARLLNERGVPAHRKVLNDRDPSIGNATAVWHGTTVSGVVRRTDPDAVGPATTRGAPAGHRQFRLARLLACGQCGHFLTPSLSRGAVRYYCLRAKTTPHGRGWISESVILPQVREEAEHVSKLFERRVQFGSRSDEARAAQLAAKAARIRDGLADGLFEKADAARRLAEVAEEESGLSALRWLRRVGLFPTIGDITDPDTGAVYASSPPKVVNAYLRRIFDRIVVESMRDPARRGPSRVPVRLRFEWRDPTLRGNSEEGAA